jgi:cell wall-associated NlpC family hydrolase
MRYIGAFYVYGGTGPSYDCSGLVQHIAAQFGYHLPRTAQEQFNAMQQISASAARPGDLVFFHSGGSVFHVGIYEGHGMMVSALDSQYGVKETPVTWGGTDYTFGRL